MEIIEGITELQLYQDSEYRACSVCGKLQDKFTCSACSQKKYREKKRQEQQRYCLVCNEPLPLNSKASRKTCSDACRKQLSRSKQKAKAELKRIEEEKRLAEIDRQQAKLKQLTQGINRIQRRELEESHKREREHEHRLAEAARLGMTLTEYEEHENQKREAMQIDQEYKKWRHKLRGVIGWSIGGFIVMAVVATLIMIVATPPLIAIPFVYLWLIGVSVLFGLATYHLFKPSELHIIHPTLYDRDGLKYW